MPLAFCILAHKNPEQLAQLIRVIWRPHHTYVVHYEAKSPEAEHRQVRDLKENYPNLQLLRPQAINWGRFSQMQVQLNLLAAALRGGSWSHAFTLSGQDFPLVGIEIMDRDLAAAPRSSFLSWFDPLDGPVWPDAWDRLTRWHLDSPLLESLLKVPGIGRRVRSLFGWRNRFPALPGVRRRPPKFFRWYGGANHHVLSKDAVSYLVKDKAALRIAGWLRHCGSPEEAYVQSALLNSSLAGTVVNDDRRAIFWDSASASPNVLTRADLPRLSDARRAGKLFARKFDSQVDNGVIEELEGQLYL